MDIILSTRNPSKALQVKAAFVGTFVNGSPVNILTLSDAGIEGGGIEDGETLEHNARKKAEFAHEHAHGLWAMSDDTGLFLPALNGAPGVHAATWAGDTATTSEITQHTLRQLEGKSDRSALFVSHIIIIDPNGEEYSFVGEMKGRLLEAERGMPQPKMPYSALFVPDGHERVLAAMSVEEENKISHRGIALRKARAFLEAISQ